MITVRPVVYSYHGGVPASNVPLTREVTFFQTPVVHMYVDISSFIYDLMNFGFLL